MSIENLIQDNFMKQYFIYVKKTINNTIVKIIKILRIPNDIFEKKFNPLDISED